jgi:hypothetical protein
VFIPAKTASLLMLITLAHCPLIGRVIFISNVFLGNMSEFGLYNIGIPSTGAGERKRERERERTKFPMRTSAGVSDKAAASNKAVPQEADHSRESSTRAGNQEGFDNNPQRSLGHVGKMNKPNP